MKNKFLKKKKISIAPLGIYPKEALFTIVKLRKPSKCPSVAKWRKCIYICVYILYIHSVYILYTHEYWSTLKGNPEVCNNMDKFGRYFNS